MGINNYDTKEFNKEELEFLRANTTLGPIATLKLKKAKLQMESYRKWYLKQEGELLEADYTPVDMLEYELRLRAWEQSWEKEWKKNPDDLDLAEFAYMAMNQKIKESRNNVKR